MPTIPQRIASAFAVLCGQYGDVTKVTAGEKLRLPAPFNLTLDTSSLPLPA